MLGLDEDECDIEDEEINEDDGGNAILCITDILKPVWEDIQ